MAKIYYNRLRIGTITFDAIPERFRNDVKAIGAEQVAEGRLSVTEYEQMFKEPYPAA